MLTTFDMDEYIVDALRYGASGFLLKDTRPEMLLDAIRTVAAGDALLDRSITRTLIAKFAQLAGSNAPAGRSTLPELTQRETDVLILIGRGLSNQEIGATLHISLGTTKTHIGLLLSKICARDRAQLVIAAYENGLVKISG